MNNPVAFTVARLQAPWGGFYPFKDAASLLFGYYLLTDVRVPFVFRSTQAKSVDVAPSPSNLGMGLTVNSDRTRLVFSLKSRGKHEDLVQIEIR